MIYYDLLYENIGKRDEVLTEQAITCPHSIPDIRFKGSFTNLCESDDLKALYEISFDKKDRLYNSHGLFIFRCNNCRQTFPKTVSMSYSEKIRIELLSMKASEDNQENQK